MLARWRSCTPDTVAVGIRYTVPLTPLQRTATGEVGKLRASQMPLHGSMKGINNYSTVDYCFQSAQGSGSSPGSLTRDAELALHLQALEA